MVLQLGVPPGKSRQLLAHFLNVPTGKAKSSGKLCDGNAARAAQ